MTNIRQLEVFKEWIDQHKNSIFKITRAYARTPMDQDDLFQEISIQIWNSIPGFKERSSPITWIYRVALNTALKWVRDKRNDLPVEDLQNIQSILTENLEPTDDRLNWLYAEIYSLNEIDRCVVLLLLDNFSYKEMANILGISESNVGVKINRIKKHLIGKSKEYNYYGV